MRSTARYRKIEQHLTIFVNGKKGFEWAGVAPRMQYSSEGLGEVFRKIPTKVIDMQNQYVN